MNYVKNIKKSGYDVVIPGSGGKDSGYTAHILKYKYGLNPLTVTWAPHIYTEIGRKKILIIGLKLEDLTISSLLQTVDFINY